MQSALNGTIHTCNGQEFSAIALFIGTTFLIFDDKQLIRIIGAQQLDKFQNALNQLG